ncbi:hypothetical protein QBC44DRAFT_125956 [Cladorrhinum sp. PSN332]|nr:hypothetical protein QBC44DRAFT_125956 [Cladorrhinum sp. PSN332]
MRVRHRKSPLLLLLVPTLAATAVLAVDSGAYPAPVPDNSISGKKFSSKDAPVDGKDGKPHAGPFVELEHKTPEEHSELPILKDRPVDPTIMGGKKIPESNDGVMDDKHRSEPKKGTTGTEGGVSEKDKERKLKEQTGGVVENKPQAPKEAPPLPHADQEKILAADPDGKYADKSVEDVSGLEKPVDLPEKTHDKPPPLPDSVSGIDHLDVTKGTKSGTGPGDGGEDVDGIIRPFHSFVLSLMMILVSEIGDKTFLIAALMAMKHDRLVVFTAALGALITMTVLSAVLGHAVPALISERLTHFLAAVLFAIFGVRLLREGLAMSPDEGVSAEMQEVEMELEEKEQLARKQGRRRSSVSPYALEMGLGSRKSRSKSRFPTPPRSPSSSPEGRAGSRRGGAVAGFMSGLSNLSSLLLSPAWAQTFAMTFLGEWGDRSQIATIAMAAGQDYWWVTMGAIVGHACCTGVAVIGGRAIAGKVSLKVVTVGGAIAFLLFSFIYFIEALYS